MDKKINLTSLKRENERLRRQLAELDEMPRKKSTGTVREPKSVQDIPTSVSKGICSIPGQEDNYYLDLYFLQKERERLVKEIASIKRRRLRVGMKVSNIDRVMAEKEEKARQDMMMLSAEPHEKPGKKQEAPKRFEYKEEEWNRFTLEY